MVVKAVDSGPRRVAVFGSTGSVGRNTVASMQSGIIYGYVGQVDGIVSRICAETKLKPRVIATGGFADLIASESKTIEIVDPLLTLTGLRILYERNISS